MERFYYKQLPKQGLIFGAIAYVDGRPAGFVCIPSTGTARLAIAVVAAAENPIRRK